MPIDLPADYEAFKAEVESDQETDDQGVYEVFWAANSRYPHLPVSERLAVAEQVVHELLAEDRVILVRAKWPGSPRDDGETIADTEATLRAWATWIPEDPVVWMVDRTLT